MERWKKAASAYILWVKRECFHQVRRGPVFHVTSGQQDDSSRRHGSCDQVGAGKELKVNLHASSTCIVYLQTRGFQVRDTCKASFGALAGSMGLVEYHQS